MQISITVLTGILQNTYFKYTYKITMEQNNCRSISVNVMFYGDLAVFTYLPPRPVVNTVDQVRKI